MLMPNHVKMMLGDGERLDHEFMNLGEDFPRFHVTIEEFKCAVWINFTASTLSGGTPGWCESAANGQVLLKSTQWVP